MHHRPPAYGPAFTQGVWVTGKTNLNETAGKAYTFLSQVARNRWGKLGKPWAKSLKQSPSTFQTLPQPRNSFGGWVRTFWCCPPLQCCLSQGCAWTRAPERNPSTGPSWAQRPTHRCWEKSPRWEPLTCLCPRRGHNWEGHHSSSLSKHWKRTLRWGLLLRTKLCYRECLQFWHQTMAMQCCLKVNFFII